MRYFCKYTKEFFFFFLVLGIYLVLLSCTDYIDKLDKKLSELEEINASLKREYERKNTLCIEYEKEVNVLQEQVSKKMIKNSIENIEQAKQDQNLFLDLKTMQRKEVILGNLVVVRDNLSSSLSDLRYQIELAKDERKLAEEFSKEKLQEIIGQIENAINLHSPLASDNDNYLFNFDDSNLPPLEMSQTWKQTQKLVNEKKKEIELENEFKKLNKNSIVSLEDFLEKYGEENKYAAQIKDMIESLKEIEREQKRNAERQKISSQRPPPRKSEGCYIATMVYGDYEHPQVIKLRKFRDHTLKNTPQGRHIIKVYYTYAPSLVKKFEQKKEVNSLIRYGLDCFITLLQMGSE